MDNQPYVGIVSQHLAENDSTLRPHQTYDTHYGFGSFAITSRLELATKKAFLNSAIATSI
jgi:hypothetical protein